LNAARNPISLSRTAAVALPADTGDEDAADQDGSGDQHRDAIDHADATGESGVGAADGGRRARRSRSASGKPVMGASD